MTQINSGTELSEVLAKWIANKSGIKIKVDFLAPDNQVGLIPNPGSHMVSEDYDGLQYWQYNFGVTLATKNAKLANDELFTIQNCLLDLKNTKDLNSNSNSWWFDDIEINSAPAMTIKDVNGTVMYSLDMAVFIYVQK